MSVKCRICGTDISIDQDLCPNCGRIKVNFPTSLPQKLRMILDDEKKRYEQQVKERDNDKKEAETKEKSDKTRIDQLTDDLGKADKTAEGLLEKNKQLELKLQQIQTDNDQLLQQLEEKGEKPVAFLVMMQGEAVSAIFNIYDGDNSFGYTNSHDRHQQIICNAQVEDVHFSIRANTSVDSKGRNRTKFYVTPRDGQIFASAKMANIISSERELEKNESVYLDDVKFTLLTNKN